MEINLDSQMEINLGDFVKKVEYIYNYLKAQEPAEKLIKFPKLDPSILESGDIVVFNTGCRAVVIKNSHSSYIMYDGSHPPYESADMEPYGYDLITNSWIDNKKFRIYRSYAYGAPFSAVEERHNRDMLQLVYENY
jgi:hypothetical protein